MSDDGDERDVESDADKRAHHNALERKRRDHIKDSFSSLRDAIPALSGEKVRSNGSQSGSKNNSDGASSSSQKASRAQILKKAAEYIQLMRRKNVSHQQDIDDLKKQNKVLEEQSTSILEKPKSDSISSLDGISDSDASDGDHLAIDGLKDDECPDESLDSSMGTFEPPVKRSRGSVSNSSSGSEKTLLSKTGSARN